MFNGALLLLSAAAMGISAAGTNISHEFRPVPRPFSDELMAQLKLPPGFKINAFARGQGNARMMLLLPDGTVLMTRNDVGEVVALRDLDGDGVADEAPVVARSTYVHGLALHNNIIYLANETRLLTMTWNTNGTFGTPVEFAMTGQTAESIQFSNPAHDYPQRIRYWRDGKTLNAEIALIDGSRAVQWSYSPMGQ